MSFVDEIKIISTKILSDNWYTLKKITFKIGEGPEQEREAYDRGNGAAILLYNRENSTIVLTRQFRMPTYINGNKTGYMIEACAGILDDDSPEECIKRETEEETGFKVTDVKKVFEAYMSPGSVTEILHFFVAEYNKDMRVHKGGGLEEEHENIEVLELNTDDALRMMQTGEIRDAKTILLLQYAQINRIWN